MAKAKNPHAVALGRKGGKKGGKAVTWTTSNIDVQVKKIDDLFSVFGWIGLFAIVLGTLFQMLATLRER